MFVIAVALTALALYATTAISTSPAESDSAVGNMGKALLRVDGMTCGGCIATIKNSLAGFEGIEDVQVDIASGTTEIAYDISRSEDVDDMAAAISAGGYPATVLRVLSPEQIREQSLEIETKSKLAIAAVGGVDIPRSDFETEMAHARSRYQMAYGADIFGSDQGKRLLDNLKIQITRRLIDESIQKQEVKRSGFTVDPSIVAAQYKAFWTKRGFADQTAFENELMQNGYSPDYFLNRFENRVLINTYLEKKIITANLNDIEKQQRYSEWFANARLLAAVTYYDKDLERLLQQRSSGGGCGNSCSKQ